MPVPILLYHQIATPPARKTPFRSMIVSPESFQRQMGWLRRLGYQGLSLRECMPYITGRKTGKVAAITFDDGFTNVYQNAMPVLQAYGFTATNFFVSNQIGGSNEWDRPLGVLPASCMDTAQIMQWQSAGHEVGAHTMDHVHLSQIPEKQAVEQISLCRERLQAITGSAVDSFAYPYGDHNDNVRERVRQAGFTVAGGTDRRRATGADDLMNLPRLTIRRNDSWLHFIAKCLLR
jgi:peptidoglycan/xylan/chitin deacetylase (PgdA/CDA1 family)